jgi:hypothetical protein
MTSVAIDAAMRLEKNIACELRLNSFKYTLGRDLEKARIRKGGKRHGCYSNKPLRICEPQRGSMIVARQFIAG